MSNLETLTDERSDLVMDLKCCDRDAFPGSRAYNETRQAELKLKAFDAEHPEVFAAIKAAEKAQNAKTAGTWI